MAAVLLFEAAAALVLNSCQYTGSHIASSRLI